MGHAGAKVGANMMPALIEAANATVGEIMAPMQPVLRAYDGGSE